MRWESSHTTRQSSASTHDSGLRALTRGCQDRLRASSQILKRRREGILNRRISLPNPPPPQEYPLRFLPPLLGLLIQISQQMLQHSSLGLSSFPVTHHFSFSSWFIFGGSSIKFSPFVIPREVFPFILCPYLAPNMASLTHYTSKISLEKGQLPWTVGFYFSLYSYNPLHMEGTQ